MTVGVAWVRKTGRADQLWVASDSRLSGDGNIWDECPKLQVLPRQGAVAAFSGSTAQAYPLLLQLSNAISAYQAASDGTLELNYLLEHLEKVANSMMSRLKPDPALQGIARDGEFRTRGDVILIGGFSRQNGLVIRSLRFETGVQKWKFARVRSKPSVGPNKPFHVYGDRIGASRFAYQLNCSLQSANKLETSEPLDFEPLQALWEFVSMPESQQSPLPAKHRPMTVGGPVQVAQVLPGAKVLPHVVRWQGKGQVGDYLFGRRLLSHENVDLPLIEKGKRGPRLIVRARGKW